MHRCVWSRNLKNEETMAHIGPQRHGVGGGEFNDLYVDDNWWKLVLCLLNSIYFLFPNLK